MTIPGGSLWSRRFLDLEDFISRMGRLPDIRSTDPAERRLHGWLQIQRRQARTHTLPLIFLDQLEALIPDFASSHRNRR